VVKNAAGFDLPKLMVGSLGSLGVMVELSFKVFPRPQAYATLKAEYPDLINALAAMQAVAGARLDIEALDLEPGPAGCALWVRLGGLPEGLPARLERLCGVVGSCQVFQDADENQIWEQVRELTWVPQAWSLIKVPVTPGRIPALEQALLDQSVVIQTPSNEPGRSPILAPFLRRYVAGGQIAWLAFEGPPSAVEPLLRRNGLTGVALLGKTDAPRLGEPGGRNFYQRVKQALDPARHLAEV